MAYYLQMNGTSDYITLPSMTFTEIVMDFRVNSKTAFHKYWSLPVSAEYFQTASGGINDQWSAGVSALYLNGVAQTNSTVVMVIGTRGVVRSVVGVAKTAVITIFANGTSSNIQGDLWDVKVYNGATLQAHYDMTLGNVLDQSGNGRNATLVGGTWVNDASTTPVAGGGTLTGTGSLTATGSNNISGGAALTGLGSLSASGRNNISGSSAMTASGSLTASGTAAIKGGATLTATGSLTASGVVSILGGAIAGGATLTAVGRLTASGRVVTPKMIEYERKLAAARAGRRLTTVELIALQQLRKR